MMRCRCLLAVVVGVFAVGLCSGGADTADTVKEKLAQAKKEFDGETKKFKQAVEEAFDKREEMARTSGDKKAVDQAKAERDAFTNSGEAPALPVLATAQQRAVMARSNLDKAYTAAVKDFLLVKEDAAADTTEKERQEVILASTFSFGKRTHLATLKSSNVKTGEEKFESRVALKTKTDTIPYSFKLQPPSNGTSQISYAVAGKYTALRVRVGVPEFADTAKPPASELTFEVFGDDKSLWKSQPSKELDAFQKCEVLIQKVKVLTLKVHCAKSADWARAFWLEPIVVE